MAAFYDCDISELVNIEGTFEMLWASGKRESWDVQKAMSDIRKCSCWAWVENKTIIHFFISSQATMLQLVKLFAHELGHTQRPYHRTLKEEQKADKYSNVAAAAYAMAEQAIETNK